MGLQTEDRDLKKFKPKRRSFLRLPNKTTLYFLLVATAATATYAAIIFWPAALAFVSASFAAAAALSVFGVAPLAFLGGLSVLATALVAAMIVVAAGMALFLSAKLAVNAISWMGHKLNHLMTKIIDKVNDFFAKDGSEPNPNPNPDPYLAFSSEHSSEDSSEHSSEHSPEHSPEHSSEDSSEDSSQHGSDSDDTDDAHYTTPYEAASDLVDVTVSELLLAFKRSVTTDTMVVRRSQPTETKPDTAKRLKASKVVLQSKIGQELQPETVIQMCDSKIYRTNFRSTQDLMKLAGAHGLTFFRTFNKADGDGNAKQAIPVQLV